MRVCVGLCECLRVWAHVRPWAWLSYELAVMLLGVNVIYVSFWQDTFPSVPGRYLSALMCSRVQIFSEIDSCLRIHSYKTDERQRPFNKLLKSKKSDGGYAGEKMNPQVIKILRVWYSMSSVSGNAEISHMPHLVKAILKKVSYCFVKWTVLILPASCSDDWLWYYSAHLNL